MENIFCLWTWILIALLLQTFLWNEGGKNFVIVWRRKKVCVHVYLYMFMSGFPLIYDTSGACSSPQFSSPPTLTPEVCGPIYEMRRREREKQEPMQSGKRINFPLTSFSPAAAPTPSQYTIAAHILLYIQTLATYLEHVVNDNFILYENVLAKCNYCRYYHRR